MLRWITCTLLAIWPSGIAAQPIPEFAGLYLEMRSGQLIEVPQARTQGFAIQREIETRNPNVTILREGPYPTAEIFDAQSVLRAPIVHESDIVSIVFQTRNDEIEALNLVPIARRYFEAYEPRDNGLRATGFWLGEFAAARWGWGVNAFDVRFLDQFTTQYVPRNINFGLFEDAVNTFEQAQFGDTGDRITNYGFHVRTRDGARYLFFTETAARHVGSALSFANSPYEDHFRDWLVANSDSYQQRRQVFGDAESRALAYMRDRFPGVDVFFNWREEFSDSLAIERFLVGYADPRTPYRVVITAGRNGTFRITQIVDPLNEHYWQVSVSLRERREFSDTYCITCDETDLGPIVFSEPSNLSPYLRIETSFRDDQRVQTFFDVNGDGVWREGIDTSLSFLDDGVWFPCLSRQRNPTFEDCIVLDNIHWTGSLSSNADPFNRYDLYVEKSVLARVSRAGYRLQSVISDQSGAEVFEGEWTRFFYSRDGELTVEY